MMEAWLPIAAIAIAVVGALLLLGRLQSATYRGYLDKHVAETAKLVEAQKVSQETVALQTAVLERIAAALEQRKS